MDKLLKEAIADAKAVRETAMANAKIALEEAFAPKLQSMLSAKINEEDDDDDAKADDETNENSSTNVVSTKKVAETKDEDSDKDDTYEGKGEDDDAGKEKDADADDEPTDEQLDLEAIIKELEAEEAAEKGEDDDAKEKDADVDETKAPVAKEESSKDGEELDLDELLKELENEEKEKDADDDAVSEAKDEDEKKDDTNEVAELKSELSEYRKAVVYLKDKINEINLLNAKLLYTNKLFKKYSLSEAQKVKILESLDRTKSVREVKLVYSTLMESFSEGSKGTKKKIQESIGLASKATGGTKKAILEEGSAMADRFRFLANLNKNKKK